MRRIEEFKAIEGKASDVRQTRTAVISNGIARNYSYECLFRISGAPVQLRVSSPIFIEDGETVRVVGIHDWNGVFAAVAYRNQSSGVKGSSGDLYTTKHSAELMVALGGVMIIMWLFFIGPNISHIYSVFIWLVLIGLVYVLVGSIMFVRSRNNIRAIKRLLNDAQPIRPPR